MNEDWAAKLDMSKLIKLLFASIVIALAISLGMVFLTALLGFSLDPVVSVITGVIGAAVFAARRRA